MKLLKYKWAVIILSLILNSCAMSHSAKNSATTDQQNFVIVIHGGAGTIIKGNLPPELEREYRATLNNALLLGKDTLKKGGTAIVVVELIIRELENSPLFNAGKGSVFSNDGIQEMDASIMDGRNLDAGAVSGVTNLKNPISGARIVKDSTKHVFLYGKRAQDFCIKNGAEYADSNYFFTKKRWEQYQRALKKNEVHLDHEDSKDTGSNIEDVESKKYGTVGCVIIDIYGNLASGTSTGGLTNKMYGRIGDSPIIGAGTYADNKTCAVSCTGRGEFFIRGTIARDIAALMEYKGVSLKKAGEITMQKLDEMKGRGGIIAVDKQGNYITLFNTKGMYRGVVTNRLPPDVNIFKNE